MIKCLAQVSTFAGRRLVRGNFSWKYHDNYTGYGFFLGIGDDIQIIG